MRVAYDSRPVADPYGAERYSQSLLGALRETTGALFSVRPTSIPVTIPYTFASFGALAFDLAWRSTVSLILIPSEF